MAQDVDVQVTGIVCEVLEISPEEIDKDASFVDDYGLDSLMALEVLAKLEKHFKIQIPEEKLPDLTTLGKTISLTEEILAKAD